VILVWNFLLLCNGDFPDKIILSHESLEVPQKQQSDGTLVWACNDVDILTNESCVGIAQFQNGEISTLVDLSYEPGEIHGFTASSAQLGFVLMGEMAYNLSILIVDLTSSKIIISPQNFVIGEADQVLDMQFDENANSLLVLVQHNYRLKYLSSLELFLLDPYTVESASLGKIQSEYWIYLSSTFDMIEWYYVVMANESGWQMIAFNLSGKISQYSIPYGFVGIACDSQTYNVYGNIFTSNASNQLALLYPQYENVTRIGSPFSGYYCGASLPSAVIDPISNYYYTLCCNDMSGCYNASIAIVEVSSNSLVNVYPMSTVQQPVSGYFWISNT